jgi:hypothetical protein
MEMSAMNDGTRFTKWDMLEFSGVPVPANPDALVDRKTKKMFMKMLKNWADETIKTCEKCEKETVDNEDIVNRVVKAMKDLETHKHLDAKSEEESNVMTEIEKEVEKAGRVLSQKNEADIAKIADLNEQSAALARGILEQIAPPAEEPAKGILEKIETVTYPSMTVTASYPLGHEASYLDNAEKAEATEIPVPIVDDGVTPEELELDEVEADDDVFIVDEDDLNAVLESLTAQGEEGTEEMED